MREDLTKYDRAERTPTAPLVDAPVILLLGRTLTELAAPLVAGVGALAVLRSPLTAAVVPPVLLFALPWLRARLGRGRLTHALWAWGARTPPGTPRWLTPSHRNHPLGP